MTRHIVPGVGRRALVLVGAGLLLASCSGISGGGPEAPLRAIDDRPSTIPPAATAPASATAPPSASHPPSGAPPSGALPDAPHLPPRGPEGGSAEREPAPARLEFEVAAGPTVDLADPIWSGALEPIVATHPTDPAILAIAYTRATGSADLAGMAARLRISRDGGRTWRETPRYPWDGSGYRPSLHSAVAWGPGPSAAARLYWVGTVGAAGGVRIAVGSSDDLGVTWSRLHVVMETPAWVGGFPDIAVDRDPTSPGYGIAYVTYNFREPRARGAGIRLLASSDLGRTWHGVDVPRADADRRSPVSWRFGSRVVSAPDGAVYVSAYQADLRRWDPDDVFDRGGADNVGRIGFSVTRLVFDPRAERFSVGPTVMATTVARNGYTTSGLVAPGTRSHTYLDPMWSHGIGVDAGTGRVILAVADVARPALGRPRGTVRVGRSDDRGRTWTWVELAAPAPIDGIAQSSFKPTLAVAPGVVFVGLHSIDDLAPGAAGRTDARIGTASAVSLDGATTFTRPELVSSSRWRASSLEGAVNGPGLRDRVTVAADGSVVYAYADGRVAPRGASRSPGRRQVFVAWFSMPAEARAAAGRSRL